MCKMTPNMIQEDGKALAIACRSLATHITDQDIADKLTAAANTLQAVTDNWKVGTPVEDFNTAAAGLEAVLVEIPQTASIAPFLPIVVAALDVLLAQLPQSPAVTGAAPSPATLSSIKETHAALAEHAEASPNPHRIAPESAKLIHHAFIHNPRGDFRTAWNNTADAHPELSVAKL